jgi:MATE family multidrug resistance protein
MGQLYKPCHRFILESKKITTLFLPLLFSQITYAASTFLGTAIIAHLGEDALAAYSLVSSIYTCLCAFFYGIFVSVCITVSKSFGANEDKQIRNFVSQGFVLACICSIPFMLIMWFISTLLLCIGMDPKVIKLAELSLRALSFSILPWLYIVVMEQFLIGISLTKCIFVISLIQAPIEIFVNYAFVFGKFGFPQCGIAGLGYGFTLVFVVATVIMMIYISQSKFTRKYQLFKNYGRINIRYLIELIRLGMPIGSSNMVESLSFLMIILLVVKFGSHELAAQGIIKQYLELSVAVILALAQSITVRVSQTIGEKNSKATLLSTYLGFVLGVFIMSVIAVIYIIFPKTIIALDLDITVPANKEIISYAKNLFMFVAIFQIFDSVRLIAMSVLRGFQDVKLSMYVTIVIFWLLGLPCAYLLSFIYGYGIYGIWYGLLLGMAIGVVILVIRMVQLLQKSSSFDVKEHLVSLESR